MDKYFLVDRMTKPSFDYILLSGEYYNKYYLYRANEFEQAYDQLKAEFAKGIHLAVLCDLDFNTRTREWRAHPLFRCSRRDERVFYDPYQQIMLHIKWYCDVGEWLNPREKWD